MRPEQKVFPNMTEEAVEALQTYMNIEQIYTRAQLTRINGMYQSSTNDGAPLELSQVLDKMMKEDCLGDKDSWRG